MNFIEIEYYKSQIIDYYKLLLIVGIYYLYKIKFYLTLPMYLINLKYLLIVRPKLNEISNIIYMNVTFIVTMNFFYKILLILLLTQFSFYRYSVNKVPYYIKIRIHFKK